MPKVIQVRDVPDDVHRTLKARAAIEGMSLATFIKRELKNLAGRPSMREWLESTRQLKPITLPKSSAQLIRDLRDGR